MIWMAHVMDFNEIKDAASRRVVVWQEFRLQDKLRPMMFNGTDFVGLTEEHYLLLAECDEENCQDYNWSYRVWNNMPNSLERKMNKWKENPYGKH